MTLNVLFYGALDAESPHHKPRIKAINELVEEMLRRDWRVLTREGEPRDSFDSSRWKTIDNIVLDTACQFRDDCQLSWHSVTSFAEADEHASGKFSEHKRSMVVLPVTDRLSMYTEMLSRADVLLALGGREGVARISIVARLLRVPVVSLFGFGGASAGLYREMVTHLHQSNDDLAHEYVRIFGQTPDGGALGRAQDIANLMERYFSEESGTATIDLQVDVSSLTLPDIARATTVRELISIGAGFFTLLSIVFGLGFYFGGL